MTLKYVRLQCPEVSHVHDSPHSPSSNLSKLLLKLSCKFMILVTSVPSKQILALTPDSPVSPYFGVVFSPVTSIL